MVDVFKWPVERAPSATIEFRVTTTQFGDGYKQLSSDGIYTKNESYAVSVNATASEAKLIMAFFDKHMGVKSFLWRPPLGELALFTCADPTPSQRSTNLYVITGTFVKSFSSVGG